MAEGGSVPLSKLRDITECSICKDVFADPRVFPCIHTFCLKCLKGCPITKGQIQCPLCRKGFDTSNVDDFPKNYFVQKLLEIKRLSSYEAMGANCDTCASIGHQGNAAEIHVAKTHCLECQQNLCMNCSAYHKAFKPTSTHTLVELGSQLSPDAAMLSLPPSFCERHSGETIKLYCFDCKALSCMMCYIENHIAHKCSDINKASEQFRDSVKIAITSLSSSISRNRQTMVGLVNERVTFSQSVTKAGQDIASNAELLKAMIDLHEQKLLDELASVQQSTEKQMQLAEFEESQHIAMLDSFKKYAEELRDKGTACDLARQADSLTQRTAELINFDVRKQIQVNVTKVSFDAPSTAQYESNNIVGRIIVGSAGMPCKPRPAVKHVILPDQADSCNQGDNRSQVCGVACLGNELFVARSSNIRQLQVYDTSNFTLQRTLKVTQFKIGINILAVCEINKCIYLLNNRTCQFEKVRIYGAGGNKAWQMRYGQGTGCSVTTKRALLLTITDTRRESCTLLEYTTDGQQIKVLDLTAAVSQLHYNLNFGGMKSSAINFVDRSDPRAIGSVFAVGLENGSYAISTEQCIAVLGADGQVVRCYEPAKDFPMFYAGGCSLAVCKDDYLIVGSKQSNRVYAISPGLDQTIQLISDSINSPMNLCLDVTRGQLYVGEFCQNGRVIVVNGV